MASGPTRRTRRRAATCRAPAARRLRRDGHAHGPRGRPHGRPGPRAGTRRADDRRLRVRQRAALRPHRRHRLGVLPLRRPAPGAQGLALRRRHPRARDRALEGPHPGRNASASASPASRTGCRRCSNWRGEEAIPPAIDGISFAPTLLGQAQEPRPFLYREFPGYGGQQSIRVGDWKGVRQGLEKPGPLRLALYDLKGDVGESRDVAAAHPDVVARLEALLSREHQPSAAFPIAAIDGETPRYVVGRSTATTRALLEATESAWGEAAAHHVGARRDRHELSRALDARRTRRPLRRDRPFALAHPHAAGRAAVERGGRRALPRRGRDRPILRRGRVEPGERRGGPVGGPRGEPVRQGLERRRPREPRPPANRTRPAHVTGWTAVALLPWTALAAKAPAGTALPPKPGDRWRFNVFRIERPGGPKDPEKDAQYLAWSPTGYRSFHVPLAFRELVFAETANVVCHEESREVMGCTGTVRACGPDASALPAVVGAALDELDRVDRLMSHYRPDSPLSRLNREAASGPVAVEPELFAFLAECLRFCRESDGAFDVTVGPAHEGLGLLPRRGPRARRGRARPGARRGRLPARRARSRPRGPSASTAPASSSISAASARATPSTASCRCCASGASPRPWSTSAAAASTGSACRRGRGLGDRDPGPDRPGESRPSPCRCVTARSPSRAATSASSRRTASPTRTSWTRARAGPCRAS